MRTAEGEREVGSWQAGSPDEALAFFQRKFASLETEVTLIEQRMTTTDLSPAQAQSTIQRLLATVNDARAVGDLDGLKARLEALTGLVDNRREEAQGRPGAGQERGQGDQGADRRRGRADRHRGHPLEDQR